MSKTTRRDFVRQAAALGAGLALPRGLAAGAVRARQGAGELSLGNEALAASWAVENGALRGVRLVDRRGGRTVILPRDPFTLAFRDGSELGGAAFQVTGAPRIELLAGEPRAASLADRLPGRRISVDLADPLGRLRATWRAVLREGSHYLRQELTLTSAGADVPVKEIRLLDLELPGAEVRGSVRGSPVVAGNLFAGFEHPLSSSVVEGGRARCALARELPLRPGAPLTCSSVIGVAGDAPGMRRAFLEYLERERAHPYRPFLHYNSWYDIGYFSKYDETDALAVIAAYGTELHARRGVTLDSFLFDDGWDDPQTLWHFHSGFPRGFPPLRDAAARFGAGIGVWLSPWGGYGRPRQERLTYGKAQGFETNEGGFALSGPRYYQRFRETCLEMIRTGGVNQFKFDGTGNVAHAIPGSAFDSDFDAMIALIGDLRAERADLFVNLTTGTYPSPFFLRYADSIWRGGEDHEFAGVGSDRQRWITYRDADTWQGIVQKGPLFPLNSLMLHGLIYARHAHNLDTDPQHDFASEIRAYFGTGTQLREMYVTPSLLSPADWDTLAEAARWARLRAGTLVDTHWVGGDPAKLEVYGHAAWGAGAGTLSLRNPKDAPQSIDLDVGAALELFGPPRSLRGHSPWRADRRAPALKFRPGGIHRFDLRPFEVLTLDIR
jgi:hypothetical protein